MGVKLRKLADQVMVITGASSGIGLTTAEMAAQAGATVVLTARNEQALREAVDRIRSTGGRATFFVADVADAQAMQDVAVSTVQEFGRIDTWVNNAGVGVYGKLTNTPLTDKRKLFETNFWGVVHGCRAALSQMRDKGGAIINLGSIASDRSTPLLGIYAASKHAVKAYTDALRMELEYEQIPVSITLIKPTSINTPFIEHARSYMANEPEFLSPVYPPEEVARAILHCAEHPMRDIMVGGSAKMFGMLNKMSPRAADKYMEATAFDQQKRPEANDRRDSLDAPQRDGSRRGPTHRTTLKRSVYTRASLSGVTRAVPFLVAGAVAAVVVPFVRPNGGSSR
jgi:short-subunit dehydrogenase